MGSILKPNVTLSFNRYDFVVVEWLDAVLRDDWMTHSENKGLRTRTAGWVIVADDTAITLAGTRAEGGNFVGAMTIPIGTIIDAKRIKGRLITGVL